jgi:hypothetical protein
MEEGASFLFFRFRRDRRKRVCRDERFPAGEHGLGTQAVKTTQADPFFWWMKRPESRRLVQETYQEATSRAHHPIDDHRPKTVNGNKLKNGASDEKQNTRWVAEGLDGHNLGRRFRRDYLVGVVGGVGTGRRGILHCVHRRSFCSGAAGFPPLALNPRGPERDLAGEPSLDELNDASRS